MRNANREAAQERKEGKVGAFVATLGEGGGLEDSSDKWVTGVTVRMPTELDPGVLVVVRASSGKGKWVAFVGAHNLTDALLAWRAKARAGVMKWRVDLPWPG